MLPFHTPATGCDAPPQAAKPRAFDLVILVLAAFLVVASFWSSPGNSSKTDTIARDRPQNQIIKASKSKPPLNAGRFY